MHLKHKESTLLSWDELPEAGSDFGLERFHIRFHASKQSLALFIPPDHIYNIWSKVCLSIAEITSHMRFHDSKQSLAQFIQVLPLLPTDKSYLFCNTVYVSTTRLRSYDSYLSCYICGRAWKIYLFWEATCAPKRTFSRFGMAFFKEVEVSMYVCMYVCMYVSIFTPPLGQGQFLSGV